MTLEFSQHIFQKNSNVRFHENPSSESQVVPCGHTDMIKLMVTFCSFVNAANRNQHDLVSYEVKFIFNESKNFF